MLRTWICVHKGHASFKTTCKVFSLLHFQSLLYLALIFVLRFENSSKKSREPKVVFWGGILFANSISLTNMELFRYPISPFLDLVWCALLEYFFHYIQVVRYADIKLFSHVFFLIIFCVRSIVKSSLIFLFSSC